MKIEFDPATAATSRQEQGLSITHAEQVLHDSRCITIEDPDARGEKRFVSLGMGALGRVLVVIHTRLAKRTQLISARKATPDEVQQYHA